MRYFDNGCFYSVQVTRAEVEGFKDSWPCSTLPDRAITFQYDKRNGDLVDITPDSADFDGPDLLALSQDAQSYGQRQIARAEARAFDRGVREGQRLYHEARAAGRVS